MYYGADIEYKYWFYSITHTLQVNNVCLLSGQDKVPLIYITGKLPNLKHLCTWSCRVWVRNQIRRDGKIALYRNKGRFLGYSSTIANIIYLDKHTNR